MRACALKVSPARRRRCGLVLSWPAVMIPSEPETIAHLGALSGWVISGWVISTPLMNRGLPVIIPAADKQGA
jgi:hypothetical protein